MSAQDLSELVELYKVQMQTGVGWADVKAWDGVRWSSRMLWSEWAGAVRMRNECSKLFGCVCRAVEVGVREDVDIYWHWSEGKGGK